jgi:hypothetical protein
VEYPDLPHWQVLGLTGVPAGVTIPTQTPIHGDEQTLVLFVTV